MNLNFNIMAVVVRTGTPTRPVAGTVIPTLLEFEDL